MKYIDIRDQLKTGDIVLYAGTGLTSKIIQYFSDSKWSHIGMIVKVDNLDMVLVWESTTLSKVSDFFDTVRKSGVQTVSLSARLHVYDGIIGIRQLNKPLSDEMSDKIMKLRSSLKNKPYEKSMFELAKSLFDKFNFLNNKEDLTSIFCSELVAEALQSAGLLSHDLQSNEFIPSDFKDDGLIDSLMLNGYNYSKTIRITY